VDDVFTTGATVNEAAKTLKKAWTGNLENLIGILGKLKKYG
jgi:predicted amidophosphoribosyltransferase